jgi:hypothetical protein
MKAKLTLSSWALNGSKFPMPGRIDPVHKVVSLSEAGLSTGEGWDDELMFNTQARKATTAFASNAHTLSEILAMGQPRPLAR